MGKKEERQAWIASLPDATRAKVETAEDTFKERVARSKNDENHELWLKTMAIINLEMERRFKDQKISFGMPTKFSPSQLETGNPESQTRTFFLIERLKSKRSVKRKIKENIGKYEDQIKESMKNSIDSSESNTSMPNEVRHIFDIYGLKLICPHMGDPTSIICRVIIDILSDIKANNPASVEYINRLISDVERGNYYSAVIYIENEYPNEYPGIREKVDRIGKENKQAELIGAFLSTISGDVSTLSYSDFYELIIQCKQYKKDLAYDSSDEEIAAIDENIAYYRELLSRLEANGKAGSLIAESEKDSFKSLLAIEKGQLEIKRTNKVDLSVGDLMFFDIVTTSKALKNNGITWSTDPSRNKFTRNSKGYVAMYYSFDGPNNIHFEAQVQSLYRYHYGEIGPADHTKLPGKGSILYAERKAPKTITDDSIPDAERKDRKKRIKKLIKSARKKWVKKISRSIPRHSACTGNGRIISYNLLDDFYEQFKPRTDKQVGLFTDFMREQSSSLYKFKKLYRTAIRKYAFTHDFTDVEKVGEIKRELDDFEDPAWLFDDIRHIPGLNEGADISPKVSDEIDL